MKLELVVNRPSEPGENGGPRILAPGAPPSPGPIPNWLAAHLEHGEVLVWWGMKHRVQLGPIAITLAAAAVALLMVTGFAPVFWSRPLSALWPPVLAVLSPTLLLLFRELANRSAVLVTDGAVITISPRRHGSRLPLSGIGGVRRDWLRGGVRLWGRRAVLRVPPSLMEDTRAALLSRLRPMVRASTQIDDPMGWLE